MRVCLINPPIEDFYITSIRRQPLGLLYIAAALEKAGHQVELINSHSPKKKIMTWPQQFDYLQEFVQQSDPLKRFPFKNYYHFGLSYQEIAQRIQRSTAEVFFISMLFTTYYEESEKIIQIIRQYHPKAQIVLGGYHAALYPEYYLKEKEINFIIAGEGELSAVALLDALKNRASDYTAVPGLFFKEGAKIVCTEKKFITDLDCLELPARQYLKARDFKVYQKKAVSLVLSRGCPHNCKFCSSKDFWGNRYRYRSIDNVLAEIAHCYQNYQIEMINFEDDNLFLNKEFSLNFLERLIAFQKENSICFDLTAMNGVSLEGVDEEVLVKMKEAGFNELNISLVTVSAELQKTLGRPFSTSKFNEIVLLAKKLKMNVRAYFILGLPEQTKVEIEQTIEYLRAWDIKIFPSVYYKIKAPINEWKVQRSSSFYNETAFFKRQELLFLFNKAIALN